MTIASAFVPAPRTSSPRAPRAREPLATLLDAPGTRTVLLGASRDPNAKRTLLVFPPDAAGPELAVKIPTTAGAAATVEREGRLVVDLRHRRLRSVERTLPRFVRVYDAGGLPAVAVTVLPGVPMSVGYHQWRHVARRDTVERDFAVVGRWLAALHRDSAGQPAPVDLLGADLDRLARRWPDDPRAHALTGRLADAQQRLAALRSPRTVVHGDFWCGNVLVDADEVSGVVDWEAGALSGEPLRDVARFALSYALYLDRHTSPGRRIAGHGGLLAGPWGAGVRHAVRSDGWFGSLVQGFVGDALVRLSLPREAWRDVLLGGLVDVAVTADHPDFALEHLALLHQLTGTP